MITHLKCYQSRFIGQTVGSKHVKGYIHIRAEGKTYKAHRLAFLYMIGNFPADQVDHINQRPADNRWSNLREATNSDNQKNSTLRTDSKSGLMGVCWRQKKQRWAARISHNGRRVQLYENKDFFEACCARKSAEVKYGFDPRHGNAKACVTTNT